MALDKRDRFIAELRGLAFRVTKARGKGGRAMVWVGADRRTTLPSREIGPKTAIKIKTALGLDQGP